MITVSEAVEEMVKKYPLTEQYIKEDLLNFSAFARKIKPEIDKQLFKDVTTSSIVMALKRLEIDKAKPQLFQNIKKYSDDILVRSNLFEVTYKKSDSIPSKLEELYEQTERFNNRFLSTTAGTFETTLIASSEYEDLIDQIFASEKQVSKFRNLASITIKMNEDITDVAGLYYGILKVLAWENISVMEVVSTFLELTILFKSKDVDEAFSVLKNFIKDS
jgi:hypothetical protein